MNAQEAVDYADSIVSAPSAIALTLALLLGLAIWSIKHLYSDAKAAREKQHEEDKQSIQDMSNSIRVLEGVETSHKDMRESLRNLQVAVENLERTVRDR